MSPMCHDDTWDSFVLLIKDSIVINLIPFTLNPYSRKLLAIVSKVLGGCRHYEIVMLLYLCGNVAGIDTC